METIRIDEIQVLIVDDNRNNLQIIAHVLQKAGYQVITATEGQKALELAKEKSPDAVLLDIMMPRMDGFEVCQKMRMIEHIKQIPIIFLSAKDEDTDIEAGFEMGGTDYIIKPFHERILLARLQAHIERGYYSRHLYRSNQVLREQNHTLIQLQGELENLNRKLDLQIQKNLHLLSTINDKVRNPLAVAISLIDMSGVPEGEIIIKELKRIDDVIDNLDRNIVESDRVHETMRKYQDHGE